MYCEDGYVQSLYYVCVEHNTILTEMNVGLLKWKLYLLDAHTNIAFCCQFFSTSLQCKQSLPY